MSIVICRWKQGGVKAVVAVDTIQVFIMLAGMIVLIVAGVYHEDVGGPSVVYDRLKETPRLDLDSWVCHLMVSDLGHLARTWDAP